MKRRVVASALAGVLIVALAGCGGGSTKAVVGTVGASTSWSATLDLNPSTTPAASASSQPSATSTNTSSLALGMSATFAGGEVVGSGSGSQVSVTVQRVIGPVTHGLIMLGSIYLPPPAGQHYVAVELRLQSTGTSPYSDSPELEMALISKNTGGPVGHVIPGTTGPGQCATDLSSSVNIAPGQIERGCVFFQVPDDQQLGAVQYETQGGDGGNLATWSIP